MNDHLSAMLSSISNGYQARLTKIEVSHSKLCIGVLDALERGGYIKGYKYFIDTNLFTAVEVLLRYQENRPLISKIKRISKPGRRIYVASKNLISVHYGLGVYVISSSKGILLSYEAKSLNVGGELLCTIL